MVYKVLTLSKYCWMLLFVLLQQFQCKGSGNTEIYLKYLLPGRHEAEILFCEAAKARFTLYSSDPMQ